MQYYPDTTIKLRPQLTKIVIDNTTYRIGDSSDTAICCSGIRLDSYSLIAKAGLIGRFLCLARNLLVDNGVAGNCDIVHNDVRVNRSLFKLPMRVCWTRKQRTYNGDSVAVYACVSFEDNVRTLVDSQAVILMSDLVWRELDHELDAPGYESCWRQN